jgi:hypothetical protein
MRDKQIRFKTEESEMGRKRMGLLLVGPVVLLICFGPVRTVI